MNEHGIFDRQRIIRQLRSELETRGYQEVTVPILSPAIPLEPTIHPFVTDWITSVTQKQFFLATSPEAGLKKLLPHTMNNLFAISPTFRNIENSGEFHTPEFLMAEWYRHNADYLDMMTETQTVIQAIGDFGVTGAWPRYTMSQLWKTYTGISLVNVIEDSSMRIFCQKKGFLVENSTWEQLFHQIFLNDIEPNIGKAPCFITDYPKRISPLCATIEEKPYLAQRFEIYINGIEIANGNTENLNSDEIHQSFLEEQKFRKTKNLPKTNIDHHFIDAIKNISTKKLAGVGLGVDRLAMLVLDQSDLSAFSLF